MGEVKDPERSDEEGKVKRVGWHFGSTGMFPGGLFKPETHIHIFLLSHVFSFSLLSLFKASLYLYLFTLFQHPAFSHLVLFFALQLPVAKGMFIPGYVFRMHVSILSMAIVLKTKV